MVSIISVMEVVALILLSVHLTSGFHLLWINETHPLRAKTCDKPNAQEELCLAYLLPEKECALIMSYPRDVKGERKYNTICYGELGCFPNYYPWVTTLRPLPLPSHPSEVNITIDCYNSNISVAHKVYLWPTIYFGRCIPLQLRAKVVFIIHGYTKDANLTWVHKIKETYFKLFEPIVFVVKWGKDADFITYLQAASNTRIAGAEISRVLQYLKGVFLMKFRDVHLIGHGLGAQVMSYAAKTAGGRIAVLTALDPAQPVFEDMDKEVRLDRTDAEYVEVIHTSAAPFFPFLGFGMIKPVGSVDFYMNGGVHQPGCHVPPMLSPDLNVTELGRISAQILHNVVSCSHNRAYEYYAEVIDEKCLIMGRIATLVSDPNDIDENYGQVDTVWDGEKCDAFRCVAMGFKGPIFFTRGPVYATTRESPLYCSQNGSLRYGSMDVFYELQEAYDPTVSAKRRRAKKMNEPLLMVKLPRRFNYWRAY